MRGIVRWAIEHKPAMNMVMTVILLLGGFSMWKMRREAFPKFELEILLITVAYPGASPDEVENGVCARIEEAIRSIEGIKTVTSIAQEGAGNVILELESTVTNVQKILSEVESAVNRIPSLPALSEDPVIQQLTMRSPAIKVGILSEEADDPQQELHLRSLAENLRDDLLALETVSQVEILGAREYQIDVQISEQTLREYGLTLQKVAQLIREQNIEVPGGKLTTDSEEILLRGKHKKLRGIEIARIPLISQADGSVLTVGDLGTVQDEFVDTTSISRVNGKPGLMLSIDAAAEDDLLAMTDEVHRFAREAKVPAGYHILLAEDMSVDVRDRLDLLKRNSLQGLLLVFLVLAAFLQIRLAFWVALGIPVSVFGACIFLIYTGNTMNMLSMFAFLIALGIVVDDAIVIGENIYSHRERGLGFQAAAIQGTLEVLPSVSASIATTIIAFLPMFFVTGVMGKFFAVLPLAILAMLVISLFESSLILPCHLGHAPSSHQESFVQKARIFREGFPFILRWTLGPLIILVSFVIDLFVYPFQRMEIPFNWLNRRFEKLLDWVIQNVYIPTLKFFLNRPGIFLASSLLLLALSAGLVIRGIVPWIFFPKLDAPVIMGKVIYPDGTPSRITERTTRIIEQEFLKINREFQSKGKAIMKYTHRMVGEVSTENPGGNDERIEGGHVGIVRVELVPNTERDISSEEVVKLWRERMGSVAGIDSLSFGAQQMGPGGSPIEFKLLSKSEHRKELEEVVERCKQELAKRPGVFDVSDDSRPGKWEFQMQVKESGRALNIPLQTIAGTVRAAYYGEEVMRLQRGRHEVKLMVRYPPEERRSMADFEEIRVDQNDGIKRPISELAEINIQRGYSEINRVNQSQSITVRADVDERTANARSIVSDLQKDVLPGLLKEFPHVRVMWEGQQEQTAESVGSLMRGFVIALMAMFALLTFEFNSYLQPFIIMCVIPFGAIGALFGHAAMGLPLTLFSVMGLVALTGVVVNDSIVLVDFINHKSKEGLPLHETLLESGKRRLRPVLLTSLTTIAGLLPLLTETSLQAQLLIPMATSLCFGLLLATILVLYMVPIYYMFYVRLTGGNSHSSSEEDDHTFQKDVKEDNQEPKATQELQPTVL